MNILAISLDWFMTIPGMLISGGVLLLVIAFIIFIVTSVKSKKEKKEDIEEKAPVSTNNVASTDTVQPTVAPVTETEPVQAVQPTTVQPVEDIKTSESAPVDEHAFDRIVDAVVDAPKQVEPVAPVIPDIVPAENSMPVLETPEATNLDKTSVSIYGGANPFVTPAKEEEHRPIYGGADPLEATMKMAPITPTPVEPVVSPIVEEATIQEPAVDTVVPDTNPSAVMDTAPEFTVENPNPDVAAVPVETEEKIEEL